MSLRSTPKGLTSRSGSAHSIRLPVALLTLALMISATSILINTEDSGVLQYIMMYITTISVVVLFVARTQPTLAVLTGTITVYTFVALYTASSRRELVPEVLNGFRRVSPDLVHLCGASILFGVVVVLLFERKSTPELRFDVPTGSIASVPGSDLSVIDLVALLVGGYMLVSLATRWVGASYFDNDIVKSSRIDSYVLTWSVALFGALVALAVARWHTEAKLPRLASLVAMVVLGAAALATTVRIGARAQMVYLLAILLPCGWPLLRPRGWSRASGARLLALVGLVAVAALGLTTIRLIRSPWYHGQDLSPIIVREFTDPDRLLKQDYLFPGLTLVDSYDADRLSMTEAIQAEIGAAVPFAPYEINSLRIARTLNPQLVERNEGFGSSPLLLGVVAGGVPGVVLNATMFAGVALLQRRFLRYSAEFGLAPLGFGFVIAASVYAARSEWLGVSFFLLVYALPTYLLITGRLRANPRIRPTSRPDRSEAVT